MKSATVRIVIEVLIAVLSGLLIAAMAPPMNWHAAQWLAYVPMLLVFGRRRDPLPFRQWWRASSTWTAVLYGVIAQGSVFWWLIETITRFSNIPWTGAVGILALYATVFGSPYIIFWWLVPTLRRRCGTWWVLAVPATLVVIEWLGSFIILFPYFHGVAQYRVLPTFQIVSVTGIWGVTFLIMLVNTAIAEAYFAWREGRGAAWKWPAFALTMWAATNLYGVVRLQAVDRAVAEAKVLRVLQAQDSVDMHTRMSSFPCETWTFWYERTAALTPGEVDLVVWPEGGSLYPLNMPRRARRYPGSPCVEIANPLERLQALSRTLDADFVIGSSAIEIVTTPDGGRASRNLNSVYHIVPTGDVTRYDKVVPLPFGEYIPLSDTFPVLRTLIEGPGDFQAGTEYVVFDGVARMGAPICYEAILPHACRRFPDPDLLVNGTLDTWFGDTAAPHQHAMLAAIRSVELGIPMVRSAYTGVSMVVEPSGRIYAETKPFERLSRVVEVRLAKMPTLYKTLTPWGLQDWFVWLCLFALGGARIAGPWARRRP